MQAESFSRLQQSYEEQKKLLDDTREELSRLIDEQKKTKDYEQEFLLNMSHEMLPALNSIQILSNLLIENKEESLSSKQINYAKIIHESGRELLNLINDIQDLSKIMAGNMPLNFEHMNFRTLTAYLKNTFGNSCANKGLFLKIEQSDNLPEHIISDRYCVEKIIMNLLSNAVKFTDKGGITIRMVKKASERNSEQIEISVSDTGIGIPDDKQEVIFEAFRAYASDVKHSLTGTGLGLSIARALAALLQGELLLESRVNEGSTFTLVLPVWNSEQKPEFEDENKATTVTVLDKVSGIKDDRHDWHDQGISILIVEDDPNFAKILFETTREYGFHCLLAEDGEAALHMANQYKPKGIILDLGLPRLDGFDVLDRLKENQLTKHIPVFVISGFDKKTLAISKGAAGYLQKPVNMAQLSDSFNRLTRLFENDDKKLVIWNPASEGKPEILEKLKKAGINHAVLSNSDQLKEVLENGTGRCILIDTPFDPDNLSLLFESLSAHQYGSDIPLIISPSNKNEQAFRDILHSHEDSLTFLYPQNDDDLIKMIHRYLPGNQLVTDSEPSESESQKPDRYPWLRDKHVLLIDPDKRNLFALSSILREKEIKVSAAQTALELEGYFDNPEGTPDMIMIDMYLGNQDGLDIIRLIRKDSRFKTLPIIALNGRAAEGDRQRSIEAGANEYLSKPIELEKLDAMLQVWLNH